MDNVIYSRTVSHPDKESSACICLTEETNGYALFEVIRLGGEAQEKKLLCWHFKWDRDGAIEHAVEYIHTRRSSPVAAASRPIESTGTEPVKRMALGATGFGRARAP